MQIKDFIFEFLLKGSLVFLARKTYFLFFYISSKIFRPEVPRDG